MRNGRGGSKRSVPALIPCVLLVSASAHAAELPGAELELHRSEAARDCMDEAAFASALRARMPASSAEGASPAHLRVTIDAEGEGFSARVVATGRIQGERKIGAAGPGCNALEQSLLVSVLLMLDQAPDEPQSVPSVRPPARPETNRPEGVTRERAPARPSRRVEGGPLWVAAGGMLTLGIPAAGSPGVFGDLSFRVRVWEAGATGFWILPRDHTVDQGRIELRVAGGQLRACGVIALNPSLGVNACGAAMVARLHGEGIGFTTDESETHLWWLAGAGGQLRWALVPRLRLGLSAFALGAISRRRFFVQGLEQDYETPRVAGWVAAEAGFQIW
jgi:hypothetical protein